MSTADHQGAAHAFRTFMRQAAEDIAQGRQTGARQVFPQADDTKVRITWFTAVRLRAAAVVKGRGRG